MQVPVGPGLQRINIKDGIAVAGAKQNFVVVRFEHQIEVVVFLANHTGTVVKRGIAVPDDIYGQPGIFVRILANIDTRQYIRKTGETKAYASKISTNHVAQ